MVRVPGLLCRRNVNVGKRPNGGYECELDVVAFNPCEKKLVHIEPSLDAASWELREKRYTKKFAAGRKYIPKLFDRLDVPVEIDQIAVLLFASKANKQTIGGGKLMVPELLWEIIDGLNGRKIAKQAVPENFPLLRTIQFVAEFRKELFGEGGAVLRAVE